jgi:hypothetical protein
VPKAADPTAGGRGWWLMSQDVHTPRVIASEFLRKTLCGCSLAFTAWRRPETLTVQTLQVERLMDEVDGKPGHVALQSGHRDALTDVPMVSLSLFQMPPQILTPKSKTRGELQ